MKYKFETKTIGDCCDIIKKSIHPEKGQVYTCFSLPAFDNSNTPEILNGEEIKSSKFVLDESTILFNKLNPKFRRVWNIHSLEKYENTICSTEFLPLKAKANIEQDYLYYYVSSPYFTRLMDGIRTGTSNSQQRIDWKQFLREPINVPSLPIQRKVVSLLRNIDKKIELNNAINNNLEQQMQALYKSWFIDFEPFNGTKPSSWQSENIYSIANIIYGAPFASKMFNTDGIGKPIIRIRDLKSQEFVTYTTEKHPKGHLIKPGDIVIGMDGEFRPYIWGNEEAWLNQRVCIFENKRPKGKAFLLLTIKPLLNVIEQTQVATTVIHIGKKDFDAFEIILPDIKTLNQFDEITTPMIEQIVNNRLENKRLSFLRDTLLPKLMSGELDVSGIDL